MGVPLPKGAVAAPEEVSLTADDGTVIRSQIRALDRWSDGTVRWALLDFQTAGRTADVTLRAGRATGAPATPSVTVADRTNAVTLDTGAVSVELRCGGAFPLTAVSTPAGPLLDDRGGGLRIRMHGRDIDCRIARFRVDEAGPLRAEVYIEADLPESPALHVFGRVECFAGSSAVRISVTLRNRSRAKHPGGIWILGDPGSVLLDAAAVGFSLAHPIADASCAVEPGESLRPCQLPISIEQESSGGEAWNWRTHANRDGHIPMRYRGYRARFGASDRHGLRASPTLRVDTAAGPLIVAVPEFWQNFPRAVGARDAIVDVSVFPPDWPGGHELQAGEQKTHVFVAAFGDGGVADPPLAWVHAPQRFCLPAGWARATAAVPEITARSNRPPDVYTRLVAAALDDGTGLFAKRERFDEYGWRHFGDLPADHESAFQPPGEPLVSHYNNQYDGVAAFARQFLDGGDPRWWQLAHDLARHVTDVDRYHTLEDKAAYNGGLFWHTQHYTDAGLSTHRTYPAGTSGGGPACEHNYNAGLMLHYFLTGDRASRDAAVGLGEWVLRMDDGRRTPLRWISGAPTGFASATYSSDYHGPGRGAGNSIVACLVAGRLSGDRRFRAKADELVRRAVHPDDDIDARHLLNVEARWSYTVFMQALGTYLQDKADRDEFDDMFFYARDSLRQYARWMAIHERPYLEKPEQLEFPNETWDAQDLRKADVLALAAEYSPPGDRATLLERARFFFEHASTALAARPTRSYTRPLVLTLINGPRRSLCEPAPDAGAALDPPMRAWPPSPGFRPQRVIARRRLTFAAAGVAAAAVVSLIVMLL